MVDAVEVEVAAEDPEVVVVHEVLVVVATLETEEDLIVPLVAARTIAVANGPETVPVGFSKQ